LVHAAAHAAIPMLAEYESELPASSALTASAFTAKREYSGFDFFSFFIASSFLLLFS
jgi:hypothetical protein